MHRFVCSTLLATLLCASALSAAATDFRILESRKGETPFTDVVWASPQAPLLDAEGLSDWRSLPSRIELDNRVYDSVRVSQYGYVELTNRGLESRDRAGFGEGDLRFVTTTAPVFKIGVLEHAWEFGLASRIQWDVVGNALVVRWVRMTAADGKANATFDIHIHPEGAFSVQVLERRDPYGVLQGGGVSIQLQGAEAQELMGGDTPIGAGEKVVFVPRGGADDPPVQYLDGDCADFDGDGSPNNDEPDFCLTVNPPGRSCNEFSTGAARTDACGGQPGGIPTTDCSDCATQVADSWHFNENSADGTCYCKGCTYSFYVLVECGTEMHLPLFDMEGARVRIFDAITGDPLGVRAENDCVKDPFDYCAACNTPAGNLGVAPVDVADPIFAGQPCQLLGICSCADAIAAGFASLVPCRPYEQQSSPAAPEVQWGLPGPPDCIVDNSNCPEGTASNLGHENQNTDVVLEDPNGLCGVFRVEIDSGGCVWDLFANCDGSSSPQFDIYQDCGDALTAWNPLPEFIIEDVTQGGLCPADAQDPNRPSVDVTLRNVGCCDETGDADSIACTTPIGQVPVTVRFEDPNNPGVNVCPGPAADGGWPLDFDSAQLKQQSGGTQQLDLPYPCEFTTLPATAIITLDPDFGGGGTGQVLECTENPGASTCGSVDVAQVNLPVCACQFFLSADLIGPDQACIDPSSGMATIGGLDATGSLANPVCPNPEYRFYRIDPNEIGNPDPVVRRIEEVTDDPANPTSATTGAISFACTEGEDYAFEVEYSCADETLNPQSCPKIESFVGVCGTGDSVVLSSVPDLDLDPNEEILCADGGFALSAAIAGAPPIAAVSWRVEERDCADLNTPGPEFPQGLDYCRVNEEGLPEPGSNACNDGSDNDGTDGADCDDPDCASDPACGPATINCAGMPPEISCGRCLTFVAETLNQRDCQVSDVFVTRIIADTLAPVGCSLHVSKRDFTLPADGVLDLRFAYQPNNLLCPATPSQELVEYVCTGQDFATCGPNGLPPGSGPYDVSNMESDGQAILSSTSVPLVLEQAGTWQGNALTFYQTRTIAACEGTGPLGLPAGGIPFNCQ